MALGSGYFPIVFKMPKESRIGGMGNENNLGLLAIDSFYYHFFVPFGANSVNTDVGSFAYQGRNL